VDESVFGFSRLVIAQVVEILYPVYMENDTLSYQRDEHRVHLIVYHLVWTPKRRKAVLINDVAVACRQLIEQKCAERGWQIIELAIQPDHIHLFVRVWPTDAASEVIKQCKGVTSRVLRQQYPQLRRLPSLWTRSYFASTAGNVSSMTIEAYIAAQKGV
jgi:putative transposase